MNMLEANMRKVSDSLNSTVRLAAEFGDESLKDLKLYTSLVEKLCEIDSKMNTHRKALAESYAEQTVECFDQRPLEVPVRNKQCNHVYEKSVIENLLKQNPRTRCPVMGCAAQGYVQQHLLEVDVRLQQQLIQTRSVFT
ncbi:AGAP007405-PA [Anopheles gambiae str. PEST]|uniref:E3 SUMO-protein ligase NSE2 n=1 Tax=Anopheles gambiae TaxID=7165 RepID=A7URE2_ANOGA|nr:AGAP007405-PA [Anopheles gambiae str. PEST]